MTAETATVLCGEFRDTAIDQLRSVVALEARIADLESQIARIHTSTRRMTFAHEWYLEGLRHGPGEYVLMRIGPARGDDGPAF